MKPLPQAGGLVSGILISLPRPGGEVPGCARELPHVGGTVSACVAILLGTGGEVFGCVAQLSAFRGAVFRRLAEVAASAAPISGGGSALFSSGQPFPLVVAVLALLKSEVAKLPTALKPTAYGPRRGESRLSGLSVPPPWAGVLGLTSGKTETENVPAVGPVDGAAIRGTDALRARVPRSAADRTAQAVPITRPFPHVA